jgi:hypothetical protein
MAGSDPAGRPLRARLGHRQRPQGPSHFWTAATVAGSAARSPQPQAPQVSLGHWVPAPRGILVGVVVLRDVRLWLAEALGAAVIQLNRGDDRFRLRWLILEKRAEGGGRNLVKMRPQNTSANSNSTVAAPKAAFALAA